MGSIIVELDDMLTKRHMTLTELSHRVDVTVANLSILKTGKARAVRFTTLAAICKELDCQPADLLRYKPDKPDKTDSTDHAQSPRTRTS